MKDTNDLLQIKINKARAELPEDALAAINSIDWRAVILEARTKKGYSIDQIGALEAETELLLCGLVSPMEYPKELENQMGISKTEVNDLVNYMNVQVFSKIKDALIKITEAKKGGAPMENKKEDTQILGAAGIEIVSEKLELNTPKKENPSILAQKLSGFSKNEVVKTEHTIENITKSAEIQTKPTQSVNPPSAYPPNADPYRLPPE